MICIGIIYNFLKQVVGRRLPALVAFTWGPCDLS